GLVPAVGILGGGAFWLGRRSNRVTTSIGDFVEPAAEILVLEEATIDRVHSKSESESVGIDR
ncbi:hypothetical protein, partial [Chamaesiphon sp. GL140_3_metabinner_50]|uniref:hypothetical protein n=1 Tax=Chamaesiphon sp. GL140_3_metabinner_50 TaxID=2970812 RepID=UPI0025F8BE6D